MECQLLMRQLSECLEVVGNTMAVRRRPRFSRSTATAVLVFVTLLLVRSLLAVPASPFVAPHQHAGHHDALGVTRQPLTPTTPSSGNDESLRSDSAAVGRDTVVDESSTAHHNGDHMDTQQQEHDDKEEGCAAVTSTVFELNRLGRLFYSGFGGTHGRCNAAMLKPLRLFLPIVRRARHRKCATAALDPDARSSPTGAWHTLAEHMSAIDWDTVAAIKRSTPWLIERCRPPPAINHWYFDANPLEVTGATSVEWFLQHYPRAESFSIHVLGADFPDNSQLSQALERIWKRGVVAHRTDGAAPTIFPKALELHSGLPWTMPGWLSQQYVMRATLAPSAPSPKGRRPASSTRDSLVDVLNDRMLPTVYHETPDLSKAGAAALASQAETMRDAVAKAYPTETRTVKAVMLSSLIFEHAKVEDFVVLRLNAKGFEMQVLTNLLQTGAMRYVDELLFACRCREQDFAWNTPTTPADCQAMLNTLRSLGVYAHEWLPW